MSTKLKAAAELAAVLAFETQAQYHAVPQQPHLVADDVAKLLTIARTTQRWAEACCNGYARDGRAWDAAEERAMDRAIDRAHKAAQAIADRYGAKAEVGGDPRGFTLRLHLASGRKNGWGDGWGIPA